MTIRKLKEMIADLPDDMRVFADDGRDFFRDNSEFVCISASDQENMAVFQTKNDIDVEEELKAMADAAIDEGWSDDDFYREAMERGYKPEDFHDPEHVQEQLKHYGLTGEEEHHRVLYRDQYNYKYVIFEGTKRECEQFCEENDYEFEGYELEM